MRENLSVLLGTNTVRYLYSFWALFVLYEAQLDNKSDIVTENKKIPIVLDYVSKLGQNESELHQHLIWMSFL